MIWIYALMMIVDGILPIFLKSCPLFWVLGAVMFLMVFFSDKIPRAVKWMLIAMLTGIGTVSALLYLGSTYATVAYLFLTTQSVLVTILVFMTPTTPRHKMSGQFS